jgi:sensor histidine kinase regulating citrate/malate metabolism
MRIPETGLCVIVSNLLRNASEAVQKLPSADKRWIAIDIKVGTVFWSIRIRNSAAIQDSKALYSLNRPGHGYGLENIRRTVEGNGGEFAFHVEDGMFSAEVNLPL